MNIGDKAPDFKLDNQNGHSIELNQLSSHTVVLYFYPKDDTPGCTLEGQDFNRLKSQFDAKNAILLGLSKDTVSSHKKFCDKYGFEFDLLSDPTGDTVNAYGVWKEKSMYGKKYMGIERSTFLIGPGGVLLKEWRNVSVKGHAQDVLDSI